MDYDKLAKQFGGVSDDYDVAAAQFGGSSQTTTTEQQKGFFGRVKDAIGKRISNIDEIAARGQRGEIGDTRGVLRSAGQVGFAIGDVGAEMGKSALNIAKGVAPGVFERASQPTLSNPNIDPENAPLRNFISKSVQGNAMFWQDFSNKHPEAAKDLEAVAGIATGALAANEGANLARGAVATSKTGVSILRDFAGGALESGGKKIQQSVIKPSARDVADGFKIENVNKYNLGGSLNQTYAKTNILMNNLSKQLRQKLGDSVVPVDLRVVYQNTVNRLSGGKASSFGDIRSTRRILENLQDEIEEVAGKNGLVDLLEANDIKRAAGTKGSWVYGSPDPDARAIENVYNTFYNELKAAIEKAAPEGVEDINRQLSELIPISNAVIRRIPIAERNGAISLTDIITLSSSMIDPRGLLIFGVNKGTKSGRVGNLLQKAGKVIKATK